MATGQEIVPVGEAAVVLYDDTSMNSSNGPPSPIVVEPGDREGPTAEEPERAFYMYAPQFHWTMVGGEDQPARSAVESIAREQYRFGTQTEECHRRLLMGQVEAERRIIELEARVAKLQDELAVQDQRIQEQRRHYEESLGKMEASYRLLQQRVTQEQGELKAEFARRIAEQTQTLRDTLHKGIADMITAQLTPVYTELTALQARSADFEDLAARMAQAEAHRDELVDKVLEIEEKEDNHIAYLEAQLAGLSVDEEAERKVDDDLEARGAAVLQDLGLVEPQTTQPPQIPVMPTADTADSVASMTRNRQGPSTSAGADQWSVLEQSRRDKMEKDKQSAGKGEDKGKLSPRRMVLPGAASSTGFTGIPPPVSPGRGGSGPGPVPTVGNVGGHMKLEPPAKFTGKGFPTVRDWLEETANWLELSPCTPDQWINIAGTRLEKGASSWFRAEKANIRAGNRAPWVNWREFAQEITAAFSAITEEEQARKQLKGMSQTGSVQNYIQRFRDLKLRIPSMSVADTYAAFMDGLKPAIRQQIAPHVDTLQQAQTMAVKVDLYSAREGREAGAGANAGKGGRGGGKPAGQKGKLGTIGENSQPDSVATVAEKKKLQELKKKSNAEAKHLKQLRRAKNQARPKTCNFCKKEGHFFRDCPEIEKLRKLSASSSGNA